MIYLDYAASSPVYREALELMTELMMDNPANPGGLHSAANRSRALLSRSRKTLAALLGVRAEELYFTSGGTESNNWAVKEGCKIKGKRHILLSAAEHSSVINSARYMERQGYELTFVNPGRDGRVSMEALERAIRPDTGLVCLQAVNNETGVIQDIDSASRICRRYGALLMCDAVQGFGHVSLPLEKADLISLSAHKLGGVRGVGALVVRRPNVIAPLIHGGGQEFTLRSGTENVPAIAAFAKAAELSCASLEEESARLENLSSLFVSRLRAAVPEMEINGAGAPRHPGIVNCFFPGTNAEELVLKLDMKGICVSPGAACAAREKGASHVIVSMGLGETRAKSSLRFSFGRLSTGKELETAAEALAGIIKGV